MIDTDALLEALALKDVARTGWVRAGHPHPESVAAHSWGVALLALVLAPPDLARGKLLAYAILHDLAEAWTGDHPPADGVTDKHARERCAMAILADRLERPELLTLWEAYEAQRDPESRFVRRLDGLDMAFQARRYAHRLDPTSFLGSATHKVGGSPLAALLEQLRPPPRPRRVLFVESGTATRSTLAVALGKHILGPDTTVEAAQQAPQPPHPAVERVLDEIGLAAPDGMRSLDSVARDDYDPIIALEADETLCAHTVWALPPLAALDPDPITAARMLRDTLMRRIELLRGSA